MPEAFSFTLPDGSIALIEWQDRDLVEQYNWTFDKRPNFPVSSRIAAYPTGKAPILLKNLIATRTRGGNVLQEDEIAWPKNRNPLDCRRSNILVLKKDTPRGRALQSNNTSGYKGVTWNKHAQKWLAHIRIHGKLLHLGCFSSPEEAARAYDEAALLFHGDTAILNEQAKALRKKDDSIAKNYKS